MQMGFPRQCPRGDTARSSDRSAAPFELLMGTTGLALTVPRLVFHVSFRGNLILLITACACVLTGIGTFVVTVARSVTRPLRGIHADRGHAEVDPTLHLSEPDRAVRQARAGRSSAGSGSRWCSSCSSWCSGSSPRRSLALARGGSGGS